jgi:hypothetical protein
MSLKIPILIADFKARRITNTLKSEVVFKDKFIDIVQEFYSEEQNEDTKEWKDYYRHQCASIKRDCITGYESSFYYDNDVWRFVIYAMGFNDIVIWFNSQSEVDDFIAIYRKYIYEDMKCTT